MNRTAAPNSLADQQRALLHALWQPRHADALRMLAPHTDPAAAALLARGLHAYRSNGRELARRALAGACPVVAQLVGDEAFEALATGLWLRRPPERGDVAEWGEALAAHIEALPELVEEEPYLPDVARLEWALHRAATAADGVPDTASFALLMEQDPACLRLRLCPGAACLRSAWPVASIVLAHLHGSPTLAEAGERLRARQGETVLVWREGLRPALRAVPAAEQPLLAALLHGASLQAALDAAPGIDFDAWLAGAVRSGLVLGADPVSALEDSR